MKFTNFMKCLCSLVLLSFLCSGVVIAQGQVDAPFVMKYECLVHPGINGDVQTFTGEISTSCFEPVASVNAYQCAYVSEDLELLNGISNFYMTFLLPSNFFSSSPIRKRDRDVCLMRSRFANGGDSTVSLPYTSDSRYEGIAPDQNGDYLFKNCSNFIRPGKPFVVHSVLAPMIHPFQNNSTYSCTITLDKVRSDKSTTRKKRSR